MPTYTPSALKRLVQDDSIEYVILDYLDPRDIAGNDDLREAAIFAEYYLEKVARILDTVDVEIMD